jgi:hypothetical protein
MKYLFRAALVPSIRGYHIHQRTYCVDASARQFRDMGAACSAELELELIQTQMANPHLTSEVLTSGVFHQYIISMSSF